MFSSRNVESSLLAKGFKKVNNKHIYFILYDENDKKTRIRTYISHNGQDINDYLVGSMSRQVGLTKGEFEDLIACPLSREELLKILNERQKL